MLSLKNAGQGGLRKKRRVRVSHVHKPPMFAKITFFGTTRVVAFFRGNS